MGWKQGQERSREIFKLKIKTKQNTPPQKNPKQNVKKEERKKNNRRNLRNISRCMNSTKTDSQIKTVKQPLIYVKETCDNDGDYDRL